MAQLKMTQVKYLCAKKSWGEIHVINIAESPNFITMELEIM